MLFKDGVMSRDEDGQVWEAGDKSVLDGGVSEGAALPFPAVGIFATFNSCLLHLQKCLVMSAQEENDSFSVGDVSCEVQGIAQKFCGLIEVDDVYAKPGAKDVRGHVGVTVTLLVTQVDSGFEEVFNCHQIANTEVVVVV